MKWEFYWQLLLKGWTGRPWRRSRHQLHRPGPQNQGTRVIWMGNLAAFDDDLSQGPHAYPGFSRGELAGSPAFRMGGPEPRTQLWRSRSRPHGHQFHWFLLHLKELSVVLRARPLTSNLQPPPKVAFQRSSATHGLDDPSDTYWPLSQELEELVHTATHAAKTVWSCAQGRPGLGFDALCAARFEAGGAGGAARYTASRDFGRWLRDAASGE